MHSPPSGAPWAAQERTPTNATSIFAALASLSGFVCFLGVGGALGVVLGLIARTEISKSNGRESGRRLANAAIALGLGNVALTLVGLAVGVTYLARPHPERAALGVPTAWAPSSTSPHMPPIAVLPRHRHEARASHESGSQITSLGAITIVDVAGDFQAELARQRRQADAAGEIPVLWVVVRNCKPCDGVAASLTTAVAQKALGKVRFLRVDRDEFQLELERLGLPADKIPGFALLDGRDRVRDFIHGGEWDADIASNIAPVLGKFVHNAYHQRRHPWLGGVRADDTPI